MDTLSKVEEFQDAFDITTLPAPFIPDLDEDVQNILAQAALDLEAIASRLHAAAKQRGGNVPLIRMQLETEELSELCDAMAKNNLVAALDAKVDQRYVSDGTVLCLGLKQAFNPAFLEVHRSNMSKLENGLPVKNEAGRVIKGPSYSPPNLAPILEAANAAA